MDVPMQIPILVINLDQSPDRLGDIARKLDSMGLSFERIVAVDGSTLTEERKRGVYRKRFWRRELTAGEIGCYLSHLKAMRYMLEKKMDKAIILEDDLDLTEEFARIALGHSEINLDFDILKLEGRVPKKQTYFAITSKHDKRIIAIFTSYGAAAYLVTSAAARRVVDRLASISYPFDDDLFCNWRNGLTIYSLFPYPACQSGIPTTIQNRDNNTGTRSDKHVIRIARIIPKNFDKMRRRIFQLRKFGLASFKQRSFDELIASKSS